MSMKKEQLEEIEHMVCVPLDHTSRGSGTLELFAREVFYASNTDAPLLLFLQGGPGFASPRHYQDYEWIHEMAKRYRIVLLDQRGTGRSSPVGPETAKDFSSAKALAHYLSHFRADQIVQDCEFLREQTFGTDTWTVLGQSFGGFCAYHYLSVAPESLTAVMTTGGIPPITATSVTQVVEKLINTGIAFNEAYFNRYPKDLKKLIRALNLLQTPITVFGANRFTQQKLLDVGITLGQESGFETLHYLLDEAFTDSEATLLRYAFAKQASEIMNIETNPLYAILHESIYCNGFASHWAADRVYAKHPTFKKHPYLLRGETIRKTMFQEYPALRPFAHAANLLARYRWPKLYDMKQLRQNNVPVISLQYDHDLYVDSELAQEAVMRIPGVKVWQHPTWHHDALRVHGKQVVRGLLMRLDKAARKPIVKAHERA